MGGIVNVWILILDIVIWIKMFEYCYLVCLKVEIFLVEGIKECLYIVYGYYDIIILFVIDDYILY